jgi:Ca2+-binding RTX toxin-like protein
MARTRAFVGLGIAVLTAAGLFAPAAHAGTVEVLEGTVVFRAAPGETNDLTVQELNLTDAGAPLTAGAGCEQISANSASCSEEWQGQFALLLDTGDRNDRASLDEDCCRMLTVYGGLGDDALRAGSRNGAPVVLDGGPGDDDLFTNEQLGGAPVLRGGDGRDTLRICCGSTLGGQEYGGPGDDHLDWTNGGTSSRFPLVLDGGSGNDTYSYGLTFVAKSMVPGAGFDTLDQSATTFSGLYFDMSTCRNCVERAIGSPMDDEIIGDGEVQSIFGGDGADILDGGGGPDVISGDGGDDTLKSRDNMIDVLSCGDGFDTVTADILDVFSRRECERVSRRGVPGT